MEWPDVVTSKKSYLNRFKGPLGAYLLEVQTRSIRSLLKGRLSPDSRVLDVGGSHGQVVTALTGITAGITVVLSENSSEELLAGMKCDKLRSPLYPLPQEDDSFSLTSAIRILTHFESPDSLLSELCRVSSEYVIFDYPPLVSFNCLSYFLFFLKRLVEKDTRKFSIFTERSILKIAEERGFKKVGKINQFFLPLVLHRLHRSVTLCKILEFPFKITGLTRIFGSPTIMLLKKSDKKG